MPIISCNTELKFIQFYNEIGQLTPIFLSAQAKRDADKPLS